MKAVKYTYWRDGAYYLGYLNDYPDYLTQGLSKEELIANLKELLRDMDSDEIPYIFSLISVYQRSLAVNSLRIEVICN